MADRLSQLPSTSAPNFWEGTWSSFKIWLHATSVHRKLKSCDPLSREVILQGGERVNLHCYRIDGTTFVVETSNGESRRVPASMIVDVEDKGDWGY